MNKDGLIRVRARVCLGLLLLLGGTAVKAQSHLRVVRFIDESSVVLAVDGTGATLHIGEHLGDWTLMQVIKTRTHPYVQYAVLEDFVEQDGRLIFADSGGAKLALAKSSEPTSADPAKLYFGHSFDAILGSPTDLLGTEILAKSGDPEYEDLVAAFPPVRNMST